jgi:thiamine phosphate synthase YjbQ (UPF0047 family)
MAVITEYIQLATEGHTDIVDITPEVNQKLNSLKIKNGIVNISVCGSTGALTTCEYEPGLVQDMKNLFDRLIPAPTPRHSVGGRGSDSSRKPDVGAGHYHHDQAWGDGNGHSHLRSSLVGPSVTFPFNNRKLVLGTWQQIIFIDFDNRPRDRKLILQFLGE